jgi:hypothetical protein
MNGSTNLQWKDSTLDSDSIWEKIKYSRFYLNHPVEFRVTNDKQEGDYLFPLLPFTLRLLG